MKIKKIATLVIVTVIFGFLLSSILKDRQLIANLNLNYSFKNFIPLILLLIPLYIINATSWFLLTKSVGFNLPFYKSIKIWLYSNISRFIPGAIWQYMGRVYMTSQEGVSKEKVVATLGLEVVFNLVTGLVIAFATFTFWKFPISGSLVKYLVMMALVVVFLLVIFTNKKTLEFIINFINKYSHQKTNVKMVNPPLRWLPVLFFSYFLQFLLGGAILFFWVNLFTQLPLSLLPVFIGIFASAWIVGYLTIFSPSGLGVQELSIAGLLVFFLPFPVASLVAVLFRLSVVASELGTITILTLFQKVHPFLIKTQK